LSFTQVKTRKAEILAQNLDFIDKLFLFDQESVKYEQLYTLCDTQAHEGTW